MSSHAVSSILPDRRKEFTSMEHFRTSRVPHSLFNKKPETESSHQHFLGLTSHQQLWPLFFFFFFLWCLLWHCMWFPHHLSVYRLTCMVVFQYFCHYFFKQRERKREDIEAEVIRQSLESQKPLSLFLPLGSVFPWSNFSRIKLAFFQ